MPSGATGLFAALLGAVAYGLASLLQGHAASGAAASGEGTLSIVRTPTYAIGLACDGGAWVLSLVALRRLPVFVVQSVLAGSLAVTAVLAAVFLHERLHRAQVAAIVMLTCALGVLAGAAGSESRTPVRAGTTSALLAGVAVVVLLVAVTWRPAGRAGSVAAPVASAGLAGLAFSGAALAARALPSVPGPASLAGEPLAWAVVAYGVLGAVAYAHALERGPVTPVTAVLWGAEVVVPSAVGVLALGDGVRPGWAVPAVLAVLAVVAATLLLSRGPSAA